MQHQPRTNAEPITRTQPRPRRFIVRTLAALLIAGSALSGMGTPERADAGGTLEEPGNATVTVARSEGRLGAAVINGSGFDRATNVPDYAYYGIVRGAGPFDAADPAQQSTPYQGGYTPPMLDAALAADDYWSYIARGLPAANPVNADVISPGDTNALGYKPNNPGTVPIATPFLLGTVRHNNFPVHSSNHWLHSTIDVSIGGIEESFPFDQEETEDDTDTTAVLAEGGAYMLHSRASGTSCPAAAPYVALNRDAGSGVWYCYRHVGAGRGNRDIYTNNAAAYPNAAGTPDQSPNSDDVLTISRTVSTKTVTIDGIPYRLVISGFTPSADGACPATPPADVTPAATFTSKERRTTYGCLYASFSQERYIRIAKTVTAESEVIGGTIPTFNFTTLGVGDFVSPTGEPLATPEKASGYVDWDSFSDAALTPRATAKPEPSPPTTRPSSPDTPNSSSPKPAPASPADAPCGLANPDTSDPGKSATTPTPGAGSSLTYPVSTASAKPSTSRATPSPAASTSPTYPPPRPPPPCPSPATSPSSSRPPKSASKRLSTVSKEPPATQSPSPTASPPPTTARSPERRDASSTPPPSRPDSPCAPRPSPPRTRPSGTPVRKTPPPPTSSPKAPPSTPARAPPGTCA